MNKALFSSMRTQLTPSPQAVAALTGRLKRETSSRKAFPWGRCVAAAACAALLLAAYPVYQTFKSAPKLHSYVTAEGSAPAHMMTQAEGVDTGAPNTGDLPGGTWNEDAAAAQAAQAEALRAYQNLMARFREEYGDGYPDWYGGSYITTPEAEGAARLSGVLVVNLVRPYGETKDIALLVCEWAGSYAVAFGDCKYSYSSLCDLQAQVEALPRLKEQASWVCGVDEALNQVFLDVPQVDDALLADLAMLDPEDDAILVRVAGAMTTQTDDLPIAPGGRPLEDEPFHGGAQPSDGADETTGKDKGVAPSVSSGTAPAKSAPSRTEDAQQATREPAIEDLNEGNVPEPAAE